MSNNENDAIEIDLMEDDDEEDEEEEEEIKIANNEEIILSDDEEEDDDDDMEDEDAKFIVEETAEGIPEQIQDPMMVVADLLNEEQTDLQKDNEETEVETETNQPQTETKSLSLAAQVAVYLKGTQNIVVEKEESIAKSIYCTALSYHSKRDYDRAIDYYFKVLKREFVDQALVDPLQKEFFEIKQNTFIYLKYLSLKNLGAIFLAKKNYSDASISLAKALTIEDKDTSLWYDYGVACFKNNDHAAAKLALEKTIILNPNHYPAFNLLLELSYIVGDIEGCDSVSKDILKLSSDHKVANFVQKEIHPSPYHLLFFQNTALSNSLYKGWCNYCIPEDEKDETHKCLVKISELDWKFICTKLLKIYAYMKSDCEILIMYEEKDIIAETNETTDEVVEETVVDEPKAQESLRRFKRKRYDLGVPL
ncbi:predicted protein [Naegleria gruberi]|uniref:Predicted protein n=1 Tax=Naegleria gruberi TaxID=5762 RepID=D2VJG5_NAEGR|nr:uncharacterized protein NAEGRDRAFT_50050 [Naegleria gruberi]EFC42940.1 predicted protein [Naegleria gruberi]|eukprot:XP_002675684.1 predicted protein [Naegleria gruberi strain NEG-M]